MRYKLSLVMDVLFKLFVVVALIGFGYTIKEQQKINHDLIKTQMNTIVTITKLHPIQSEQQKKLVGNMIKDIQVSIKDTKPIGYNFDIPIQKFEAPKQKKPAAINSETNLKTDVNLSVDDMNKIIAYWDKYVNGGTPFKNKGDIFIKASKETGLDPVYILAHAAWESAWGNSSLARNKHNYFGIAAYDRDPYANAYVMGDDIDKGIIQGAKWIKSNYYNKGYTSLEKMISIGNYASASSQWIRGILSIMRTSYAVI